LVFTVVPAAAAAQGDTGTQHIDVPLTNPGQPVVLHASLMSGGLKVEGQDVDKVVVEVIRTEERDDDSGVGGMKRIPGAGLGLTVEEKDNVVEVSGAWNGNVDTVAIKVPRRTSMKLSCVNGGDIVVSGVEGELELQNTNGGISALNVSGEVVAHTTNGEVKVIFDKITPGKAMSFVTFNGNVDVTFPPGLKSDLRIKTDSGNIYTDFDFQAKPQKTKVESKREGGKFQVSLDQDVRATIGGGGPEMYFKTWSGDVYIRKSGK
ncbi:MAG TPA: DUF4097 family beta strand repeat-containing protein, partial [Candidatus Saccharimonadales bacterium]|nr:DUF4097 family beta strand repeat-containing protein [Candidatus Saccharimonadales bacterium]